MGLRTNSVKLLKHVWIALVGLLLAMLSESSVLAQPRPVTWETLDSLRSVKKIPKNSIKRDPVVETGGLFSSSGEAYDFTYLTPRGLAAAAVIDARENFKELDSANYNPDKFNKYFVLRLRQDNFMPTKVGDLQEIKRVVLEYDSTKRIDADSLVFIKSKYQNSYGATGEGTDADAYFKLDRITGDQDLTFWIFISDKKFKHKLKASDILKLE